MEKFEFEPKVTIELGTYNDLIKLRQEVMSAKLNFKLEHFKSDFRDPLRDPFNDAEGDFVLNVDYKDLEKFVTNLFGGSKLHVKGGVN